MKLHLQDLRRPAGTIAVLAAAAGLVLTGCGPSSGSGSNASGAKSPASSGTSPSASSSGGSSGGSTSVTSSASVPFPSTAGDSWKYKDSNGDTVVNKITSVTSVSAGQQVTMSTLIKSGSAAGTTNTAYYIVQPNGQISLPFSQFSTSGSGVTVKLISGTLFWPSASALASGQSDHSTLKLKFTINGKTQKVTEHVTVKGEGTQSVTVPAGTYSATVVQMTEAEKFMGYNIDVVIRTWLANGVGPVQSELTSVDGSTTNIVNKQELVSFHHG